MRMKDRISTTLLKLRLSLIHLRHRLHLTQADAFCGSDLFSRTPDPFSHHMKGTLKIGNSFFIGKYTEIVIAKNASLEIGDHVGIGSPCCIGCEEKITIGNHVMIAEFTTIRDNNHGIAKEQTIDSQKNSSAPISIGNDVWIGAGCVILKGAVIPDGCVIGAHSMVLQKSQLVPYGIYAGTPVRLIRMR